MTPSRFGCLHFNAVAEPPHFPLDSTLKIKFKPANAIEKIILRSCRFRCLHICNIHCSTALFYQLFHLEHCPGNFGETYYSQGTILPVYV